jgi:hypothetical protein
MWRDSAKERWVVGVYIWTKWHLLRMEHHTDKRIASQWILRHIAD